MDAHAETCELVVPGDPGLVFGLESVYGALGEGELDRGGEFCVALQVNLNLWK